MILYTIFLMYKCNSIIIINFFTNLISKYKLRSHVHVYSVKCKQKNQLIDVAASCQLVISIYACTSVKQSSSNI